MKNKKKFKLCVCMMMFSVLLAGCSTVETTVNADTQKSLTSSNIANGSDKTEISDSSEISDKNEMPESADTTDTSQGTNEVDGTNRNLKDIQIVGLVTEVFGNEITIQLGNMEQGQAFAGVNTDNVDTTKDSNGSDKKMERGNAEMSEKMKEAMDSGGAGGGTRGTGAMPTTDFSEIVELTDETQSFNIPVGTKVQQFGSEMTFSQIAQDMYITITTDENDKILSVNILG